MKEKIINKKPKITLSSTCLGNVDIKSLCKYAVANNICGIELSANLPFMPDGELVKTLKMYTNKINFYNYLFIENRIESAIIVSSPIPYEASQDDIRPYL